jgi:outer membrane protein assembly factor BamB
MARKTNHGMNCATPIVLGNKVLLASNIGTQLIAVNTNGATSVWNIETPERGRGPCHADPVVIGDAMYEFTGFPMEDKLLRCLSLADGKELWTAEIGAGWLLPIDGHVLCLGNRGTLVLIKPNPAKFEKVTECAGITGKPVWTPPVVAGTNLYLRFKNTVICYCLTAATTGSSSVTIFSGTHGCWSRSPLARCISSSFSCPSWLCSPYMSPAPWSLCP